MKFPRNAFLGQAISSAEIVVGIESRAEFAGKHMLASRRSPGSMSEDAAHSSGRTFRQFGVSLTVVRQCFFPSTSDFRRA